MYSLNNKKAERIEPLTFSELDMIETDMEEILRCSIDILCDDEEDSMLIVGRQVKNEKKGRSDLTAIDKDGNIVLIEIKRDRKDIESRKEAFEFQAIRYAASYATIKTPDDLVKNVFAPYIEKYRSEYETKDLTSYELGFRKLNDFLLANKVSYFNSKQRVFLVASDFDEQTLSAVAWLNSNNVDISCFKMIPYKHNQDLLLDIEKLLPVPKCDDFYVNLMNKSIPEVIKSTKDVVRRILPKIDAMLEWGIVKEGDPIISKNEISEGVLCANGNILVDGVEKPLHEWLKEIYGWSSIQTYAFAVHKSSGKTLYDMREEYMNEHISENI